MIFSKSTKKTHRSYKRKRRGSFLLESAISLFLLVSISVVLLNSSFNILKPRNWTMKQNLVDAFLSQDVALANRIDFETIATGGTVNVLVPGEAATRATGWGNGAAAAAAIANATTQTNVTMGLLPSFTAGGAGRPYTATVHRVRIPLQGNAAVADFAPANGASLTLADLGIRAYKLETHVEYTLGGNTYVKSRTVIRSQ